MPQFDCSSATPFDRGAEDYDALRRRLIPCFDAFYGTALALIANWSISKPLRVLDLGAGTGLFAGMILDRYPDASVHLVDASAAMLEQSRRRFAGRQAIECRVADMATADLGGPWDLIVSALAIHHLEDPAKQDLFARIRTALVPGGLFVNAEQVLGPTPNVEALYERSWLQAIRDAGVSEEEIGKVKARMAFDRCAPVEDLLAWMRDAGFEDVDCSFKSWRFAVMSGRRTAWPAAA
jgi:ubiquinone/menaquinone biosynthesis C-methylase UbiE